MSTMKLEAVPDLGFSVWERAEIYFSTPSHVIAYCTFKNGYA